MINKVFNKRNSLWSKANILFITAYSLCSYSIFSQDDNLKKEIHIPFPENITIDEAILLDKKKATKAPTPAKSPVKKNISIPFPNDPEEKNSPNVDFKKIEIPNAEEIKKDREVNVEFPLDKVIVFPKVELPNPIPGESKKLEEIIVQPSKEAKTGSVEIPKEEVKKANPIEVNAKEIKPSPKPTTEIGKALTDKEKPEVKTTKTIKKPGSKLDLGEYGVTDTPSKPQTKDTPSKSTPAKKAAETNPNSVQPITNLPNVEKPNTKKGKGKKEGSDESMAPYERSKYYLNRDDKPSAVTELNSASSGDGENSNLAKMDQIRLLAHDRRKNEAKNVIDGISDLEFKYKGLYELAVGLENAAKGDKKLKEESIPFHLAIITEAPKTNPIVPKSLWALSHLLFTIGDHTPALDHLSNIIKNHADSEYIDDAIYLSGRIYEESTSIRNLNRAQKYYQLFLKNADKSFFKNSIYTSFVKKRLELLEN